MAASVKARRVFVQLLLSGFLTALVLLHAGGVLRLGFLDRLEALAYDLRLNITKPVNVDDRIVIVDIDESSLKAVGRWPWPRKELARLFDKLYQDYFVAAVGTDIVFVEPDQSSGLPVLEELAKGDPVLARTLPRLRATLDYDGQFAEALGGGATVLGFYFRPEGERQAAGQLPPPALTGDMIEDGKRFIHAVGYGANLPQLADKAMDQAFFNMQADFDGVTRRMPALIAWSGNYYQSLPLGLTRAGMGGTALKAQSGRDTGFFSTSPYLTLDADGLIVPLDEEGMVLVPYRKYPGYNYIPAIEVMEGKVPLELMENRIVLLGTSAPGLTDLRTTPVAKHLPGVEIHANLISGILDGTLKHIPAHVRAWETTAVLILGLVLAIMLPLASPVIGTLVAAALAVLLVATNYAAWQKLNLALPLAAPFFLVVGLYILNIGYGFFAEARSKRQITKLFGQYVPPELASEMSKDPTHYSMEGQSREMTVLFSDIRGFTNFSENLPPTELAEVLNAYLSTMTRIVQENKGTIDKYIGDAIMAFWNAPVDLPNHAESAVDTALAMQAALPKLNEEFAARNWPEVKIGIGVNTGRMSVGNMGSEFRMSYTVMGDAVNLGSRLEGITKQYGIGVLATETAVAADKVHTFMKIDVVRVKGKAKPVAIYQPLGRTDQLPEEAAKMARIFESVFERYQSQNWDEAEKMLHELMDAAPCKLCEVYLERIAHFRENPPPRDWDGVFVYTTK
jgi:adenylate cyclase